MNTPNKLTVFRMILVPVFMIVYLMGDGYDMLYNYVAAGIFITASITDWADGYLARKNGDVTTFGKFMDPIADKLLVTGAFLCLLNFDIINIWAAMIVLAREFSVSGLRLVAAANGNVIAAGKLGKLKTVTQLIAVPVALIFGEAGWDWTDILIWISVVLALISGIDYIAKNKDVINQF